MSSGTNLRTLIFASAALALAFTRCGNKESSEPAPPAATVDRSTTGSISGTVTLSGAPPLLKPIDMSANASCVQGNKSPVTLPMVITGENGALANVVIYVKSGLGNYRFDPPQDPVILAQKNCMYEPHVLAMMTQQPFEIQNNDPTMHNVHPMPKHNRQWSTSQPAGSAALKSSFTRTEFAMPVLCSIHPWMRSFVFVFDNPYFAVTAKTGKFEIANLPPGSYTIEAWQEHYGTQDQSVTIGPKESKAISFTFAASGPNH